MIIDIEKLKVQVASDIAKLKANEITGSSLPEDSEFEYYKEVDAIIEYLDCESYCHTAWHDSDFDLNNPVTIEILEDFNVDERKKIEEVVKNADFTDEYYDATRELSSAHHTDYILMKIEEINKVLKPAYDAFEYVREVYEENGLEIN
ncbi:MAG: hypothetical protein R3Y60_04555 [bacterium]